MSMKLRTLLLVIFLAIPPLVYLANPFATRSYDLRARILGVVPYRIPSKSMDPTLQLGDFIVVYAGAYSNRIPDIGDVVVFKYPKDKSIDYVKRVIARGGETVVIKNGVVSVNDAVVEQPYVNPENNIRTAQQEVSWEVPEGFLFMLGDNRDNSNDSRYWGFVAVEDVVGQVKMIWLSKNRERIGKSVE